MRTLRAALPLLALALLLAACSGSGAATTAPTAAPATADPGASEPPPAAGAATVELATTSLGDVLADGEGNILYIFTDDTDGVSNCSGDCLANWPALASDAAPAVGEGLDAPDFTLITRDDGSSQVAFLGMPLYYFAGDTAPGETNGQGLGGKWYVVDADGTKIGAPSGRLY